MAGKKIIDGAIELTGDLTGGHITGTLLQSTQHTDLNKTPGSYPVFDDSGLIYSRTAEETKADLGIPTKTSQLTNDSGYVTNTGTQTFSNSATNNSTQVVIYKNNSTPIAVQNLNETSRYTSVSYDGVSVHTNSGHSGSSFGAEDLYFFNDEVAPNGCRLAFPSTVPDDGECELVANNTPANNGLAIGRQTNATNSAIHIGSPAFLLDSEQFGAKSQGSTAIGCDANISENSAFSTALGFAATVTNAQSAVQLGPGENKTEGTLQFRDYTLVNADGGVPTERLFKDVFYVEEGFEKEVEVSEINTYGISLSSKLSYLDSNDNVLTDFEEHRYIPIVAGDGISITTNDNGKAEISSQTKRVMLANSASGTGLIQLILDCSFPDTITTASALGTYLYNANKRACCVGGIFNGKPVAFGILTSATAMGVSYYNGSTHTTTNTSISSLSMTVFDV